MQPETIDGYLLALGDLTIGQVREGVQRAARAGGPHPPSAGDLRKLCTGKTEAENKAIAMQAYKQIDFISRTKGRGFDLRKFDQPTRYAIAAMGGWKSFCTTSNEWQLRNFMEAYVEAMEAAEVTGKPLLVEPPSGAVLRQRQELAKQLTVNNNGGAR